MFKFEICSNIENLEIPDQCPDNPSIEPGHSGLKLGVSGACRDTIKRSFWSGI